MSEWLAALLGSAFGALATWCAVARTHKHNVALKQWDTERETDGVLLAIEEELRICAKEYFSQLGQRLENSPSEQVFNVEFDLADEYGLTYRNHLHVIGGLNNEHLRSLIIETHLQWSFLFEALRGNSRMLRRRVELGMLGLDAKEEMKHSTTIAFDRLTEFLRQLTPELQRKQTVCKELTARMSAAISDYRQSHPVVKPQLINFFAD